MEIYTIRDGYNNIVEAFIVKELADAFLAHLSDEHPDWYFDIEIINTNDGEYAEESYIGRKIYYGAKIFLEIINDDVIQEGVSTRTSLKKIDTCVDVDTICENVCVYFEVDKEIYEKLLNIKRLEDEDFGKELIQKAIDIYKKFKKETTE